MDTNPHLWTFLIDAPLSLALPKSNQLPLSIIEFGDSPSWTGNRFQVIMSIPLRIRSLTLEHMTIPNITALLDAAQPPPFPALHHLNLINVQMERLQWQTILQACPVLDHLQFNNLQLSNQQNTPTSLIGLPESMQLECVVSLPQTRGWGKKFGLQWTQLQKVALDITYELKEFPPTLHRHAVEWIKHWSSQVNRDATGSLGMQMVVVLHAPVPAILAGPHGTLVTSSVEVAFTTDPRLAFKLQTRSHLRDGVEPSDWHIFPSLFQQFDGTTHLVIHPAESKTFKDFNPSLFVEMTHPTTVTIKAPKNAIANEKRGNWLRSLWKAHLQGVGWNEVSTIACEASDLDLEVWVREQCEAAEEEIGE